MSGAPASASRITEISGKRLEEDNRRKLLAMDARQKTQLPDQISVDSVVRRPSSDKLGGAEGRPRKRLLLVGNYRAKMSPGLVDSDQSIAGVGMGSPVDEAVSQLYRLNIASH